MGRERSGKWKYFYFFVAGLIFSLFLGCTTLREAERERDAREHILRGGDLLAARDYEGSLRENQKALSLSDGNTPGDEALFAMGLIYAHYEYPKRDRKKSLDLFNRLVNMYPQSPLTAQAKIWMGILQENDDLSDEIEELNRTSKKTKQDNERLSNEIEELTRASKKTKQDNERLSNEIEELRRTIKKTKQVDIEIEEKMKELSK